MLRGLAVIALLAALVPTGQGQPPSFDGRYQVLIAGRPVARATVWVYYFGYGYRLQFAAGTVIRGAARIHADPAQLDHDIASATSNWPTYVIAIEVPGVGWYRSHEFGDFIGDFQDALRSMGEGPPANGRIDLPAPVRQVIHVRNADGSPRGGEELRLSTYVSNDNHCARHMGFRGDDRRVVSAANGDATFTAPLNDLFLDNTFYTERQSHIGRSLSMEEGMRLPAGREHLVQGAWERAAPREFRIRVAAADGSPVTAAVLLESEDQDTCDYSNHEFRAGPDGVIVARFALEHASQLCFEPDGDGENCLVASQWEELSRTGRLDVRWPRPPR